jgi:hypothetical protein
MAKQVYATIVLLCLCTSLLGGCNKGGTLLRDTVRVALEVVQPQSNQPLAVTFSALGDHWNDQNGVPWAAAGALAQMCKLSYASEAEINATLSEWGLPKVSHFRNESLYACVASDDHTVLIAFRGTDDSKDWLVNADATPQPVRHGIIHRGFYQGMKSLYPEMVAASADHGVERKHLWITGHSLGGALAVAFAYESLAEGRVRPAGVVTFGQPLLADTALGSYVADQLGGNYVRFVNERDVVTRVPPGYVHFGKLVWFHDGKLELDTQAMLSDAAGRTMAQAHPELSPLSTAEFQSLQQGIRDLRQLGKNFDPARLQSYSEQVAAITDHFMAAYIHGIDTFANGSPSVASR